MKKLELYHGTNVYNVQSIIENGFKVSNNNDDRLGYGVYFFTHGISCPIKNALAWATNNSYNVKKNEILYDAVSVLSIILNIENMKILDLTDEKDLETFNITRNKIILHHYERLRERRNFNIKKRKDFRVDDQIIMNMVCNELKIDGILANLYIKSMTQKVLELESSLPNATIFCLRNKSLISNLKINVVVDSHPTYYI